MDDCESRLEAGADPYVSQSWCLWKADILATAGLHEEASSVGRQAVESYGMSIALQCAWLARSPDGSASPVQTPSYTATSSCNSA